MRSSPIKSRRSLRRSSRATHNADRTPENSYCVAFWRFSDLVVWTYVRFAKTGRSLKGAFDPTETLAAPNDDALDAGFWPIKVPVLAAKIPPPDGCGSAAISLGYAWSLTARALQRGRNWRIAVLMGGAESDPGPAARVAAFGKGLGSWGRTCGPS